MRLPHRTKDDDDRVRARFEPGADPIDERLTEATSEWDKLAETYDAVLRESPGLNSKRELLSTLARVHNEKRDDPRRALRGQATDRPGLARRREPLRGAGRGDLAGRGESLAPVVRQFVKTGLQILQPGESRQTTISLTIS